MCGNGLDRVLLTLEGGVLAIGNLKKDSNGSIELEKAVLVANGVPIHFLSLSIKKEGVKGMLFMKPGKEKPERSPLLDLIDGLEEVIENLFDEEELEKFRERLQKRWV